MEQLQDSEAPSAEPKVFLAFSQQSKEKQIDFWLYSKQFEL